MIPIIPTVIPIRNDYRYRAADSKIEMENAAVVIYMMDVSGSMGDEQKEIVRTESFWINLWLKSHNIKILKYAILFTMQLPKKLMKRLSLERESGGTLISSAYKLCQHIIEDRL
jgi:uncharacterized sporulation protein YeaH/YhbH (DUF444 family)